jgi:hypothetical protein
MGQPAGVPYGAIEWRPDPGAIVTPAIPIAQDDDLVLTTWAYLTGQTLAINCRLLTPGGPPARLTFYVTVAAGAPATVKRFPLPAGWLLDVSVTSDYSTLRRGDVFIQLALEPSTSGADVLAKHTILIQDYLQTGMHLAWPGSGIRSSLEGGFKQTAALGTNPAAGAEISEAVPSANRWNLKAITYTLVTSAAVATRQSHLIIDDGANILLDFPSSTTQTASLTRTYFWAPYAYAPGAVLSNIYNPIPAGLVLPTGWRFRTVTDLIDAADDYSAPRYWIERYIEP